jgi:hypothetical protein
MTSPVRTLATTVRPSATLLEYAEIAVVEAAISDTSAKVVEGLVEGHLYQLVNGRFVECELTHSGSDWAFSSVPSTLLSTSPILQQPSYAEVVSIKKTTLPASTGLENKLEKLSTNTDETADSPEVISIREDQREVIAGPGKELQPDSKAAAKEKRKPKRQAAKAAAAAAKANAVAITSIIVNDDVPMANANPAMGEKPVAEDDTLTLVTPRRGQSVWKLSFRGRRRGRLSTGSVVSREGAGKHV